jgi:hypothetical protein
VAIPLAQQRKLLQRSGNMCAFPGCGVLLTAEGTPEDPVVVLGEIAHIVAESPGGPRGESPLTAKQRNSYPNLILLCSLCRRRHKEHKSWRLHRSGESPAMWSISAPGCPHETHRPPSRSQTWARMAGLTHRAASW